MTSKETLERGVALARIDTLEAEGRYVDGVDVYARAEDGSLRFAYESWAYKDREGYFISDNVVWSSEDARAFVRGFQLQAPGEPMFHLLTRTADSATAPYDPPLEPIR